LHTFEDYLLNIAKAIQNSKLFSFKKPSKNSQKIDFYVRIVEILISSQVNLFYGQHKLLLPTILIEKFPVGMFC